MSGPRKYVMDNQIKKRVGELTEILDDALDYAVAFEKPDYMFKEKATYAFFLTDGKIDPVKLNKLSIECEKCVGLMDEADFSNQSIQDFLEIRNDIMKVFDDILKRHVREQRLQEFHAKREKKHMPSAPEKSREQVPRQAMSESVSKAIKEAKAIKSELIEKENNYRQQIKIFCKKIDDLIEKRMNKNLAAKLFLNKLNKFMLPYRHIAALNKLNEEMRFELVLEDIAAEKNLHDIHQAAMQYETFYQFAKLHERFFHHVVSDHAIFPIQQLPRYGLLLGNLDKNVKKIDSESIESKTVDSYLKKFSEESKKMNDDLKAQKKKEFDAIKGNILMRLNKFIDDRSKQRIKFGHLSNKVLAVMQDIAVIEVSGTDADVKKGLKEMDDILNGLKKEAGLLKWLQLRGLVESVDKRLHHSRLFVSFNMNKAASSSIKSEVKTSRMKK
jgi:hypothetical protein